MDVWAHLTFSYRACLRVNVNETKKKKTIVFLRINGQRRYHLITLPYKQKKEKKTKKKKGRSLYCYCDVVTPSSLDSRYGNTLQVELGIIREPSAQFQASPRSLLLDAETKMRMRLGNCSSSYNDTYDDVSGDFVHCICDRKEKYRVHYTVILLIIVDLNKANAMNLTVTRVPEHRWDRITDRNQDRAMEDELPHEISIDPKYHRLIWVPSSRIIVRSTSVAGSENVFRKWQTLVSLNSVPNCTYTAFKRYFLQL